MTRYRLTPAKIAWNTLHYSVLCLASVLVIGPLLIAFFASFKTPIEMLRGEKTDLPIDPLNIENYANFIDRQPVGIAFYNTLFVIVVSLVIVILVGTMVAYVISRYRFSGRGLILILYVIVMAVPQITTRVSLYQVMLGLGLVNSKWALIVLYSSTDIVSLYTFITFL